MPYSGFTIIPDGDQYDGARVEVARGLDGEQPFASIELGTRQNGQLTLIAEGENIPALVAFLERMAADIRRGVDAWIHAECTPPQDDIDRELDAMAQLAARAEVTA